MNAFWLFFRSAGAASQLTSRRCPLDSLPSLQPSHRIPISPRIPPGSASPPTRPWPPLMAPIRSPGGPKQRPRTVPVQHPNSAALTWERAYGVPALGFLTLIIIYAASFRGAPGRTRPNLNTSPSQSSNPSGAYVLYCKSPPSGGVAVAAAATQPFNLRYWQALRLE